jgi:hypothetical protein
VLRHEQDESDILERLKNTIPGMPVERKNYLGYP